MHILITGAKGQLGNELLRILATKQAEIGPIPQEYNEAEVDAIDRDTLDLTDACAVQIWFDSHKPYDVVINCAAFTNVDGCETNFDAAYAVNATAVAYLASEVQKQQGKLVQVSTDYVFSGIWPTPRVESDAVGPKSMYGETKLAGEGAALNGCTRSFVVRTAWLYGYVGNNFVKTMLRLGSSHEYVTVVDDQFGNPTSANDLAYELLKIALTTDYGIYHCTNEDVCSWADFAQEIMKLADLSCEVKRCSSQEYQQMNPQTAQRPHFSALENKHLADTIGNEMRPWREAIAEYLHNVKVMEG